MLTLVVQCGHEFGSYCLAAWLEPDPERRPTCPMCRAGPYRIDADDKVFDCSSPPIDDSDEMRDRLLEDAISLEIHLQRILGWTYHSITYQNPEQAEFVEDFIVAVHRLLRAVHSFQDTLDEYREGRAMTAREEGFNIMTIGMLRDSSARADSLIMEAAELGVAGVREIHEGMSEEVQLEAEG